jgi:hypothetical protein
MTDDELDELLRAAREDFGPTRSADRRMRRRLLAGVAGGWLASSSAFAQALLGSGGAKIVSVVLAASLTGVVITVTNMEQAHPEQRDEPAAPARAVQRSPSPSPPPEIERVPVAAPAEELEPISTPRRRARRSARTTERNEPANAPNAGADEPAGSRSPSTLGHEADLLARAIAAQRSGAIETSRALLEAHRRAFPEGALAAERERLARELPPDE